MAKLLTQCVLRLGMLPTKLLHMKPLPPLQLSLLASTITFTFFFLIHLKPTLFWGGLCDACTHPNKILLFFYTPLHRMREHVRISLVHDLSLLHTVLRLHHHLMRLLVLRHMVAVATSTTPTLVIGG